MAYNPLYNEIFDEVRVALNKRGFAYGSPFRNKSAIDFPYKKMAYAYVEQLDENGSVQLSLGIPRKGGFTSLYNTSKLSRNLPKLGTLSSVEISNQGEMGSLQKAKFDFTVYTLDQLDSYETKLMKPGTSIRIRYGWSVDNPMKADSDSMVGIVYNFSYSLNTDGSFNCNVEVVSKGFYTGGASSDATLDTEGKPAASDGKNPIYASNLKTFLESFLKNHGNLVPEWSSYTHSDGYTFYAGKIKYDPEQEKPAEDEKVKVESEKVYYMSLNSLVKFFNKRVLGQISRYEDQDITYSSDLREQTDDKAPQSKSAYYSDVCSAMPESILLSDSLNAKYGSRKYYIGDAKWKFDNESVNLGEILISTDLIIQVYDELVDENEDEPVKKSINNFLGRIFDEVSKATGGIYQLSLVSTEDAMTNPFKTLEETPTRIVVIDKNYTGTKDIKKYTFRRSIHKTLIKSMDMSSELPNEAATTMYAGGRSNVNSGATATAGAITEEDDSPKKEEWEKAKKELYEARTKMSQQGSTYNTRESVRTALKNFKSNPKPEIKNSGGWISKVLYPINLTLTIDGIAGLRFGNVITTDWLPSKYRGLSNSDEMVFVITKVDHKISGGTWETTIETQCRLS